VLLPNTIHSHGRVIAIPSQRIHNWALNIARCHERDPTVAISALTLLTNHCDCGATHVLSNQCLKYGSKTMLGSDKTGFYTLKCLETDIG